MSQLKVVVIEDDPEQQEQILDFCIEFGIENEKHHPAVRQVRVSGGDGFDLPAVQRPVHIVDDIELLRIKNSFFAEVSDVLVVNKSFRGFTEDQQALFVLESEYRFGLNAP